MSTGSKGLKLESFDSVESKAKKAEESAKKSSGSKGGNGVSGGSPDGNAGSGYTSRLAGVYEESESVFRASKPSPYAAPVGEKSSYTSSSPSYISGSNSGSGHNGGRGGYNASSAASFDSTKYANKKGISSDSVFGRDDDDGKLTMLL